MSKRLPVKVYYEDTDSLGVVYYANYLKYFERGRSECIEALGGHVGTWNARGYNFVVYKIAVTYHHAARLGDQCEVATTVLKGKSPYRLKMDQRLYRGAELLTSGVVELLCLDKDFELREFPAELLAIAADA